MKAFTLDHVFTEYIPVDLAPGSLYISMLFETAVHLCACGCGSRVVTPLGRRDWTLTFDGTVSLRPSIGNGQQPCRSHYYIRANQIDWMPRITRAATSAARQRDQSAHTKLAPSPITAPQSRWRRIVARIRQRPCLSSGKDF